MSHPKSQIEWKVSLSNRSISKPEGGMESSLRVDGTRQGEVSLGGLVILWDQTGQGGGTQVETVEEEDQIEP